MVLVNRSPEYSRPASPVASRRTVAGSPDGLRQGSVTEVAGKPSRCSWTSASTPGDSGTVRVFSPFGEREHQRALDGAELADGRGTVMASSSMSSGERPKISPCRRPSPAPMTTAIRQPLVHPVADRLDPLLRPDVLDLHGRAVGRRMRLGLARVVADQLVVNRRVEDARHDAEQDHLVVVAELLLGSRRASPGPWPV